MHRLDDSFRHRREASIARRRQQRLRRVLGGGVAVAMLLALAGAYLSFDRFWPDDSDKELAPIDLAGELPDDASVYVPIIVDLAGDPMWIVLAGGGETGAVTRTLPKPPDLTDAAISPTIEVLSDVMLSSSESFMTTIPSTQEDFAFFQAQRAAAEEFLTPVDAQADLPEGAETVEAEPAAFDPEAGWGETIEGTEEALPEFQKTEVENNISFATVTPETERFALTEDKFVRIRSELSLESVAQDAGFSAEDARQAVEALSSVLGRSGLQPGDVVAMRGFRPYRDARPALRQISIYSSDTYIGSLARNGNGPFVRSVDPWVRDDLFNYTDVPEAGGHKRNYRLLDAIYSTAARNDVPTGVIGEAIMYLSRGQDLNTFATYDQRLILIYSDTARGAGGTGGRVLYVAVAGSQTSIECIVFPQADGEFACVSDGDRVQATALANGMITPVAGVLRSTFGPRKHPILNTVRLHKGVDWAAAVGTPVVAAFDGTIAFAGDGGGYGNLLRLSHEGGRETRYAHLHRFAGQPVGTAVKAGDVIGYVGTTGLSTGPHLHFEVRQDGTAIDPLGTIAVAVATSDLPAIEVLTNRIIQVESGGKARAKNPLSSATGLGQFINSTWIRMMNTYRPDLARSLSTAELLELRFDPTISREMVRNLAREGENYLRARGHGITAGRLYLCHFLGMEGAHVVLSSPGDALLVNVLGQGVIKANPFLTGKTTSYVIAWAERKMGQKGAVPAPQPAVVAQAHPLAPGFEEYKSAVLKIAVSVRPAAPQPEAAPAPGTGDAASNTVDDAGAASLDDADGD